MAVLTLSDLRTVLNTILDDTGTTFWSDTERNEALNGAYRELYNHAVSLNDGQGPETTTATIDLVADTETVALPTDLYKLVQLYYKESTDEQYEWVGIMPHQRHEWRHRFSRASKSLAYYRRGSNLVLVPTPNYSSTGKLFVEYVPNPTDMSGDSDVPTGIPASHRELIAYKAAKRLTEKQGIDLTASSEGTLKMLLAAFERDLESWNQSPRRLAGLSAFDQYDLGT